VYDESLFEWCMNINSSWYEPIDFDTILSWYTSSNLSLENHFIKQEVWLFIKSFKTLSLNLRGEVEFFPINNLKQNNIQTLPYMWKEKIWKVCKSQPYHTNPTLNYSEHFGPYIEGPGFPEVGISCSFTKY
jgi:hypothetical protein